MKTTASYPARAAIALGYLKRDKNDIDIYVEDQANPNMWVKFLKNILPRDCKIDSVSVLGGRDKVIDACRADQMPRARARVYIIDGDFDILLRRDKPRLRHLYRLRAYCIENYFINKTAILFAATVWDSKCSEPEAENRLDLDGWIERNNVALRSLFVSYAVAQKLESGIQTIGYSVQRLLRDGNQSTDLCPDKVRSRVFRIYRQLCARHGRSAIRAEFEIIQKNALQHSVMKFTSGKDYIFPALYKLLKVQFGLSIPIDAVKVLLASRTDSSADPYLKRSLLNALGG